MQIRPGLHYQVSHRQFLKATLLHFSHYALLDKNILSIRSGDYSVQQHRAQQHHKFNKRWLF